MSNDTLNAYNYSGALEQNDVATAAVVDILTKACSAGDDTNKINLLIWASEADNLKTLRDKIKESASE